MLLWACVLLGLLAAAEGGEVVLPLESEVTELEPLKGLVFWQSLARREYENYGKSISLEFVYLLYNEVVLGQNRDGSIQYDWSSFEETLDDIKSRGHQAIVRMRYTQPGDPATAVPDFIKESSGYEETTAEPGGERTYYPDWRSELLKSFHLKFYTDLSARYDRDPRIAFFQSGFGHYAEYHISGTELELGRNFPSKDFQAEFLQHIEPLFQETPISFGIESAKPKYSPVPERPELAGLSYGLFDDSFMQSRHDYWQEDGGYNEGCLNDYNYTTRVLRAPIGGEISYFTSDDQHSFLGPKGIHGTTWENASSKYHITYMFANDCLEGDYATTERVMEAGMHVGYHLLVTDFRVSENSAKVSVRNTGIAPVYHSLFVTVNNVRATESLKLLAPNSTKTFAVEGLNIDLNSPVAVLNITSDKLYVNQTVPFEAHCTGEPNFSSAPSSSSSSSSSGTSNSIMNNINTLAILVAVCAALRAF